MCVINLYRGNAELFVGGETILSTKGTTQGDSLSMAIYALATVLPLIHRVKQADLVQTWLLTMPVQVQACLRSSNGGLRFVERILSMATLWTHQRHGCWWRTLIFNVPMIPSRILVSRLQWKDGPSLEFRLDVFHLAKSSSPNRLPSGLQSWRRSPPLQLLTPQSVGQWNQDYAIYLWNQLANATGAYWNVAIDFVYKV